MKMINKNRNRFALLFLTAYLTLIFTNVIHFHKYALLEDSTLKEYSQTNNSTNHFYSDKYLICFVHQFSSGILDLKFSCNRTVALIKSEDVTLFSDENIWPNHSLNTKTNRAPPVFS